MPSGQRIECPRFAHAAPPAEGTALRAPSAIAALEALLAAHYPRLAKLARRLLGRSGDVEDAVQEVFLAAWARRRQWPQIANLEAWLVTILVRQCRARQRRAYLWRSALERIAGWMRSEPGFAGRDRVEPRATRHAAPADALDRVRTALERLSPADREVLVLREIEGMDAATAAAMLGLRRGTLDVRLSRARARLRGVLESMGVGRVDG